MHIRGNVRELEGALVKLSAVAALGNEPVTLAMATDALSEHLAQTDSALTLGDIEMIVAAYFGITPADIHSSRRTRTVSLARMVAMTLARRHTPMSYPEIARFMGKNHSSAVLAVQRFEKLLAVDANVTWMTASGPRSAPSRKLLDTIQEQLG
jgi:chromosomal replication initiator protein